MTTIAYKNGIVAADRGATSNDVMFADGFTKIMTCLGQDGRTYAGCLSGPSGYKLKFVKWFTAYCLGDVNLEFQPSGDKEPEGYEAAIFDGTDNIVLVDRTGTSTMTAKAFATGSGREFAYGAMSAGASAVRAVKIACRHDIYSSEGIDSVDLHKINGELK